MKPGHSLFEELEQLAADSGWVHGLARKLVADAHLAEDVVQDAWVEALKRGGEAESSLSAWLAGVVKNLAKGNARSAGRRRDREERSAKSERALSVATTSAKLEQQGLLIQSVLGLRQPYRDAIVMRFIDELPPREIAAKLDVPLATVNSRIARGLDQLREELLRAHGGDETRWLSALVLLSDVSSKDGVMLLGAALVKSKIAIAAGLCLLVVGGWWIGTGPSIDAEPKRVELALGELSDSSSLPAIPPQSARDAVDAENVGSDAPAELATGETFLVRVIDGETGAAASGAQVYALEPSTAVENAGDRALQRLHFDFEDLTQLARSHGEARQADAAGELRLPVEQRTWQLSAEWEGKSAATLQIEELTEDCTLTLWPSAELRVTVRDEAGRALSGIGVAVKPDGGNFVFARARTDASGVALLRPWLLRHELLEVPDVELLRISIDEPLEVPVSQTLHLEGRLNASVELVCSPVGTLEVEIFESAGKPLRNGTPVALELAGVQSEMPLSLRDGVGVKRVQYGVVTFEHVGVGLEFNLSIPLADYQELWETQLVGPERPLETVRRRIVLDVKGHEYQGQILDPQRAPLANASFLVTYTDESRSGHTWKETTDAAGRFRFELLGFGAERPTGRFWFLPIREPRSRVDVQVALEDLPPGDGPHDLGEIWFGPEPTPIVSGVVLDPFGRPVPDAWVSWTTGAPPLGVDPTTLEQRGSERTDENGRFTFYGEFGQAEVWLNVHSGGRWRHERERLLGPSTTVELHVVGAASIRGRLLVDEGMDISDVVLALWNLEQGPPGARLSAMWRSYGVRPDGSFEIQALDPGTYAFDVSLDHDGGRLFFLDDVEVRDDGTTDARLEVIDLRGGLRALDVTALNADGQPMIAEYWFVPDEGRPIEVGNGPRVLLASDAEGSLLALLGPALPAIERIGVADSYVLRSPVAHEVEVLWGGAVELGAYDGRFTVKLYPLDRERRDDGLDRARGMQFNLGTREVELVPGRRNRVLLPGPGRYRVTWSVHRDVPGRPSVSHWPRNQDLGEVIDLIAEQNVVKLAPDEDWAAGRGN